MQENINHVNSEELQIPQLTTPIDNEIIEESPIMDTDELSDDEKKKLYIEHLKSRGNNFNPIKNQTTQTIAFEKEINSMGQTRLVKIKEFVTNQTTNQFGVEYKQKRKRKNKQARASRKANRN